MFIANKIYRRLLTFINQRVFTSLFLLQKTASLDAEQGSGARAAGTKDKTT